METDSATMDQPAQQVEAIFAKETWTHGDCVQLCTVLFDMPTGTEKFRTLTGRMLSQLGEPSGGAAVKAGMALYLRGDYEAALKTLAAGTDNRDRRWYQGLIFRQLARYDQAEEQFARAADRGWDADDMAVAIAQSRCLAGDVDAAEAAVAKLSKLSDLAEYHVLRGLVLQARSDLDAAEEAYGEALDLDPENASAAFRLAYLYDLQGDEQQAIELYEQCSATPPVNVHALINLAVLYEDASMWDQAELCLQTVLSIQPNHARARLYARDVLSSRTMYYDEELERRQVQRNAVLDVPVTDFELSVRARNCLKKMNIYNLGDLLRVTEADLLASKNFGETSLAEIKTMLSQKGLQLGQEVEIRPTTIPIETQTHGVAVSNEGVLATPVAELQLSVRARKALERLGVATVGDLTAKSEAELLTCKNFGHTSLTEVKQRLTEYGLELLQR